MGDGGFFGATAIARLDFLNGFGRFGSFPPGVSSETAPHLLRVLSFGAYLMPGATPSIDHFPQKRVAHLKEMR